MAYELSPLLKYTKTYTYEQSTLFHRNYLSNILGTGFFCLQHWSSDPFPSGIGYYRHIAAGN